MDTRHSLTHQPYREQSFLGRQSKTVTDSDTISQPPFDIYENNLVYNEHRKEINRSEATDDIPHHLLVQLGLAKPRERPEHQSNRVFPVRSKDARNIFPSNENAFTTASVMYDNLNLRPLEYNENVSMSSNTKYRVKTSENGPQPTEESQKSLSQLFFSEEEPETMSRLTRIPEPRLCSKSEIIDLQFSDRTNYERECQTVVDCKTGNNISSGSLVQGNHGTTPCGKSVDKSCDMNQEEDSKHLDSQSSFSQLFQSQEFNVTHYRDIMRRYGGLLTGGATKEVDDLPRGDGEVDEAQREPDGGQNDENIVQNDENIVQNDSSGVQAGSNSSHSGSDSAQIDSDVVSGALGSAQDEDHKEIEGVQNKAAQNDLNYCSNDGGKISNDTFEEGPEVQTINSGRNLQPFIIRGCEPKMFDVSIKRKEDNPWKSEVRQGVLEPVEEVSKRDHREIEEIPMIVSPYFPNEGNHPVQEDKRTSLYGSQAHIISSSDDQNINFSHNPITDSPHDPQIIKGSSAGDSTSDIFHSIFQQEENEELKLIKDFFKRGLNDAVRCTAKKPKISKKDRNPGKSTKITNYFPVLKQVTGGETQSKYKKTDTKISKNVGENEKIKHKFESNLFHEVIIHDSTDNRKSSQKRSCSVEESKKNASNSSNKKFRSAREFYKIEPSVGDDLEKFKHLGGSFIEYHVPSKHVFRDLPPGSVQSISQLKQIGFDRGKAVTTSRLNTSVTSRSPKSVEVPTNQAKIVDFLRVGMKNCEREIRILEEKKVEETALEMESSGELFEIGFTLCYKEKYSVLNRPDGVERKRHHPVGVMSRVEFTDGKIITIYQSVTEIVKENGRSFLLCLLESNCRKVCFEAQAFIMFVMEIMKENDDRICLDWMLLDPIVGMWLLNPDFPPHSFKCAIKEFNVKVEGDRNQPFKDWKYAVRDYMEAQGKILEHLHSKLTDCRLWDVFYHLETPLIPILACMERRSIEVNYEQLKDISKMLQGKLNSLEQSAWSLLGKKFQLSSPLQLRAILYDELKLDEKAKVKVKTANSGVKSTDEGSLKLLLGVHPLPAMILEYRRAHKIKSTYIDGLLTHVVDKKSVYTTWEQCAAATGRITSSSPNLQSIPKQDENLWSGEEGFNVRKIFISRPKHTFVAVDFQQIELRVFAHLSQDESLLSAFQEPGDIFQTMTRIRIGKQDFEPSEREKTKTLMYALLYGAGANKISELLTVGFDHALQICCDFYGSFPGLKRFRAQTLEQCRVQKELRSLSGRRRLFPNIRSPDPQQKRYTERQALNFVIQGSAADISKAAMLRAEGALKARNLQANLLLHIHDELLWEVSVEHAQSAIETIKKAIEHTKDYWINKFNLKVDLPVKIKSGSTWGDMKPTAE